MTTLIRVYNSPDLYVDGLGISWASNTTLTIATGSCRDSTNAADLVISSAKTLNAAVVGLNGIDTGTFAASTTYAVFVIGDSSGYKPTGVIMSLSTTAPTLPFGYDLIRRIGWGCSDVSTHFYSMHQSGSGKLRSYLMDIAHTILSGGTSATFADVAIGPALPIASKLYLQADHIANAAEDKFYVKSPGDSVGLVMTNSVAGKKNSYSIMVMSGLAGGVQKISYKVDASGNLSLYMVGFDDSL